MMKMMMMMRPQPSAARRGRARARGALRRHEKLLLRQVNFFFIKLFKN